MAETNRKVRLQIPVDQEVSDLLDKVAGILRRTKSQTAALMLEEAIAAKTKLGEWIATRISSAFAAVTSGGRKRSGQSVYIQVFVSAELASQIERLADRLRTSPGHMASMLLEDGTHDNAWIVETL